MNWTWFFFFFFLHKRTCLNATLELSSLHLQKLRFSWTTLLQYDIRFLFIKWNLSTDFFSSMQSAFLKRVRMTECKEFTIDPIDLSIERWFNGKRFCRHNKYVRVLILVWATISSQLKSSKHLTISSNVSFFLLPEAVIYFVCVGCKRMKLFQKFLYTVLLGRISAFADINPVDNCKWKMQQCHDFTWKALHGFHRINSHNSLLFKRKAMIW